MTTKCASCGSTSHAGFECVSFTLLGEAICGACLRMFTGAAADAGCPVLVLDESRRYIPPLGGGDWSMPSA